MALLLSDNTYLKFELDGSYLIYKNKTARNRAKKDIMLKEILNKYKEILIQLSDAEYLYFHPEAASERAKWANEAAQFYIDLKNFSHKNKYPLIEQFFPNASKAIPDIVEKGKLSWLSKYKTLEEIYNKVKELELFEPKKLIQDI